MSPISRLELDKISLKNPDCFEDFMNRCSNMTEFTCQFDGKFWGVLIPIKGNHSQIGPLPI